MQLYTLIAGAVVDERSLGVYALMRNVANLVAIAHIVADWAVATRIAAAWAISDRDALLGYARLARRLSFIPGLGVAGLIALTAPVWFGVFDVPIGSAQAWAVLGLLLASNLAIAIFGLGMIFANQCGLERDVLRLRALSLITGSAVAFAAGWLIGAVGVAFGVFVMNASLYTGISARVQARTGIRFL